MGLYTNRILAPTKELSADWFPEEGEIFRDSSGNFYCGDNVTASNALTPINGGAGSGAPVGLPYVVDLDSTSASGIAGGTIRFNATPPENATAIYITEADANANAFGSTLASLSAGGLLYINVTADDSAYCTFKVTAAVDSGSYYTLTASYLGGSLPTDGAEVRIVVAPVEVTGVKRYVALLTQTGTDAPVATVLENSLGGTVVWSYDTIGSYTATLAGAFGQSKTTINIGNTFSLSNSDNVICYSSVMGSDSISISIREANGTSYDNELDKTLIVVTTYP